MPQDEKKLINDIFTAQGVNSEEAIQPNEQTPDDTPSVEDETKPIPLKTVEQLIREAKTSKIK